MPQIEEKLRERNKIIAKFGGNAQAWSHGNILWCKQTLHLYMQLQREPTLPEALVWLQSPTVGHSEGTMLSGLMREGWEWAERVDTGRFQVSGKIYFSPGWTSGRRVSF